MPSVLSVLNSANPSLSFPPALLSLQPRWTIIISLPFGSLRGSRWPHTPTLKPTPALEARWGQQAGRTARPGLGTRPAHHRRPGILRQASLASGAHRLSSGPWAPGTPPVPSGRPTLLHPTCSCSQAQKQPLLAFWIPHCLPQPLPVPHISARVVLKQNSAPACPSVKPSSGSTFLQDKVADTGTES